MLVATAICLTLLTASSALSQDSPNPRPNHHLGTIFNNDINNILWHIGGGHEPMTPEVYQGYVDRILDLKPGILAQNVGFPEGVIYRTKVDTTMDKYWAELCQEVWPKEDQSQYAIQPDILRSLFAAGTDPLKLTIEACRKRGVPVLASYRMNAEDLYQHTWRISDFGRAHADFRIPGAGCLDPARPEVFDHRMAIFAEVASDYDIDGIEMDFRRWFHMVSDPSSNHTVLTRMVRDVRKMLDETAARKGRSRMLLGVRVGPMLKGKFVKADFPGSYYEEPTNASCETLGLDVETWIREQLVDYVAPTLFEPTGLPRTKEFVELAHGTNVGIYPTLSYTPTWAHESLASGAQDDEPSRHKHRNEICHEALACYAEGAHGVSLFNWWPHLFPPVGKTDVEIVAGRKVSTTYGDTALGFGWVQQTVMPKLSDPAALRALLESPDPIVPPSP
jgi:hypothetical protein